MNFLLNNSIVIVFVLWLLSGLYNDYVKYFKVTVNTSDTIMDKYINLELQRKYNGSIVN